MRYYTQKKSEKFIVSFEGKFKSALQEGSVLFTQIKCCQKQLKNCTTCLCVCFGIMQKGFLQTWLWAPVSKQEAAKPQVWSQSLVSRSRKPECWFSCFYLFVIGVLWLLPIWKDCSAPLDTPVTFYAWSLLQFWHYFLQSYEHELNQYPLSVLLCPCLHVFSNVLSTCMNICQCKYLSVTSHIRTRWCQAPLQKTGDVFAVVFGPLQCVLNRFRSCFCK